MSKLQFKTNVKCGACVAAITPEMDKVAEGAWKVDLTHPDRVLTVDRTLSEETIIKALNDSGYQGERI
ncbi:heavy-metal-associated domain-containing protein [Shivajiella indica]|uniref:Heavy-metal-associated domain-containing protein n=1 Tax=Shivajiella indica TaxID=872115 RepID=A0ABW5B1U5_9BACT